MKDNGCAVATLKEFLRVQPDSVLREITDRSEWRNHQAFARVPDRREAETAFSALCETCGIAATVSWLQTIAGGMLYHRAAEWARLEIDGPEVEA